jgi:undecaprenyl-diphosphatase
MLDALLNLDTALLLDLNGSWGVGWDTFFYWMSDKWIWIPLYLAILGVVWRRHGWKTLLAVLVFIALAVLLADNICNLAKYGLKKLRPTHDPDLQGMVHTVRGYVGGLYGTFSAHAATCCAIAAFTTRLFRTGWYTVFIWLWVVVVSYSRIYLGVHFPLDILCGSTVGFLAGWWAFVLFRSARFRKLTFYR